MKIKQLENITIVLLPGLNGTEGLFKAFIEANTSGFDVLTISYPTHKELSYKSLTSFVLSKLDSINNSYILMGESFSGPLSIFISHQKPSGLIATILVATFVTAPNFKVGRFLPWNIGFKLIQPLYSLRLMFSKTHNASFIKSISTELQKVSPNVLAGRIQSIFAVDAQSQLKDCKLPMMYFRGKNDFIVPRKNLDKMLSIKPDIKVVEFDTQHFLLQSAPKEAWQAITTFVADVRP